MLKRSLALLGAAALAATLPVAPASAQRTKLTIYTAIENDQLGPFKQAIEAAVPEVEVVWVRDSTGVITARFLAEKDNPRSDIVLGLAVTSLIAMRLYQMYGNPHYDATVVTYTEVTDSQIVVTFRVTIPPGR